MSSADSLRPVRGRQATSGGGAHEVRGLRSHRRGRPPVGQQFEERLALIERYEQAGFHAYHLAEHHGTPLGHGPSPSVFIAAATERTTTLRLGPLVNSLPLHHPLRLIEEVCMLDHLSDGRLQLGVGARDVGDRGRVLRGRLGQPARSLRQPFRDPAQGPRLRRADPRRARATTTTPCPWCCARSSSRTRRCGSGSRTPGRAEWVAEHEVNVVALLPGRDGSADHRRLPGRLGGPRPRTRGHPLHGRLAPDRGGRHRRRGDERRAAGVPPWFEDINLLWRKYEVPSPLGAVLPEDFATGTPPARASPARPPRRSSTSPPRKEEAGINYFCADLAFGDITFEEASRTVSSTKSDVIPAFDPVAAK